MAIQRLQLIPHIWEIVVANIQERKSKDGKTSYRVQVRLKGFPPQTATFERKTDAKRWVLETEAAIREGWGCG
jgi:hypothetical protein